MVRRCSDDCTVDRRHDIGSVDAQRGMQRRCRELANVNVFEQIENRETIRLISGGFARLFCHRVVLRRSIDTGDRCGFMVVRVTARLLRGFEERTHHLRRQASLEGQDVDARGWSPPGDEKQPRPGRDNTKDNESGGSEPSAGHAAGIGRQCRDIAYVRLHHLTVTTISIPRWYVHTSLYIPGRDGAVHPITLRWLPERTTSLKPASSATRLWSTSS